MLQIQDLVVQFGTARAVDGLSVDVPKGALYGLLGPNGAGKTTTLRCATGLQSPTSGQIRVDGLDPVRDAREVRRRVGLVPQRLALYEDLTVLDNLRTFAGLYGLRGSKAKDRVDWGIALAQLSEKTSARVGTLSGGMKRRLNMACSLLHDPSLIICDEPTTGVDPQSRNHLFETVKRLHQEGRTVIYTTHYLEEVEALCDTVAIMDRGRLLRVGALDSLLRRADESAAFDVTTHDTSDSAAVLAALSAAGIHAKVTGRPRSLEDVFLELTGRALRDGSD